MNDTQLLDRLERVENRLGCLSLQLQQLLETRGQQHIPPATWVRPKHAVEIWQLSDSTLRKWRSKEEWSDGSIPWIEGIHWKKRQGYNRLVIEHWFTHRHDRGIHLDYIARWAKASDAIPGSLLEKLKQLRKR